MNLWHYPSELLPDDDAEVLTYHVDESGFSYIQHCFYNADTKQFEVFMTFVTCENSLCSEMSDLDACYDIADVELWMPLDKIMPHGGQTDF